MKSIDFRQLAIIHYRRLKSYRKAAKVMNVAASTIFRWVKLGIDFKKRKYVSRLYEKTKQYINDIICRYSGIVTYQFISNELQDIYGVKVSTKSIGRFLQQMEITPKMTCNKTKSSTSPENVELFKKKLCNLFDTNQTILSVDECYFSEKVLPKRGYWFKGKKLITDLGPRSWKKRSLLMSVGNDGSSHYHLIHGSVNSIKFETFMTELPSHTTILDNAPTHRKKSDVKLFIPSYSPQYNPIEYIFSKVKNHFRKLVARKVDVDTAILKSLQIISTRDIQNTFQHVNKLVHEQA